MKGPERPGPPRCPFPRRGTLLGKTSYSVDGPFGNPGGVISFLFCETGAYSVLHSGGALSRLFHAASRFEVHLNRSLKRGNLYEGTAMTVCLLCFLFNFKFMCIFFTFFLNHVLPYSPPSEVSWDISADWYFLNSGPSAIKIILNT